MLKKSGGKKETNPSINQDINGELGNCKRLILLIISIVLCVLQKTTVFVCRESDCHLIKIIFNCIVLIDIKLLPGPLLTKL